ncbi:MAG: hypothetical protein ACKOA8_18005 [Deltaproteobacteria bacterium]
MTSLKLTLITLMLFSTSHLISYPLMAEEESSEPVEELLPANKAEPAAPSPNTQSKKIEKKEKRYFGTEKEPRIDAGIFHVAFAAGGNFFIEPKLNATTKEPLEEYFNDFGFGGGVIFDYDYSKMTENIPLMLRGFVGYRYILKSVHVFDVQGIARRMWQFSDTSSFGVGLGFSSAVWYRTLNEESLYEETLFLPSLVVETGFEFNPVMVELKWLINRFGQDSSINGLEFLLGIRF